MGDNRISHNGGIGGRTNQLFDVGPPTNGSRNDLFLRSESPRVQQILLHQRLREEIEKNSNGKVRYLDSELYVRNQELRRSPAFTAAVAASTTVGSEVPLQIGGGGSGGGGLPSSAASSSSSSQATLTTTTTANKQSSRIPINSTSSITSTTTTPTVRDNSNKNSIKDDLQLKQQSGSPGDQTIGDGPANSSTDLIVSDNNSGHHHHHKQQRDQTNNLSGTIDRADDCQVCHIKKVREDLMNLNKMIQERNVHFSELKAKCLRSYFKRQMID